MSSPFLPSDTQPGGHAPGFFAPETFRMRRSSLPCLFVLALALGTTGIARAYEKPQAPAPKGAASAPTPAAKPAAKLVDINRASAAELKTLPGIGDAEAAKIIANRPYMTKTGLVEKQVLTIEAYDPLRSRIVVVHKTPPPKPKT